MLDMFGPLLDYALYFVVSYASINSLISFRRKKSLRDWTISRDLPSILYSWERFCTYVNSLLGVLPAISFKPFCIVFTQGFLTIMTSLMYFGAWIKSKELPTFSHCKVSQQYECADFQQVGALYFSCLPYSSTVTGQLSSMSSPALQG